MRSLQRILGLAMLCLAAIVSPALAQNTSLPEIDSSDYAILQRVAELTAQIAQHDARLSELEARCAKPTAATDQTPQKCAHGDCACGADCKGPSCQCGQKQAQAPRRFTYRAQMTWPGWTGPDRFNALRRHLQTEWHSQAASVWQMSDIDVVMLHDRLHGKDNRTTLVWHDGPAPQPVAMQAAPAQSCPGGNCGVGDQMLSTCPGGNCNTGKRGRFGIIW